MSNRIGPVLMVLLPTLLMPFQANAAGEYLDLAPFGRWTAWEDSRSRTFVEATALKALPSDLRCVGVVWDEERDVREIRARFRGTPDPGEVGVEYWYRTWPPSAPAMPTIEDPADDHWKGRWLRAQFERGVEGGACTFRFKPLSQEENEKADNLPGVKYRRTLKMRLTLPRGAPPLESLEMFSDTTVKPLSLRIEFGCGESQPTRWSGRLEIYNGTIVGVKPWQFAEGDGFEAPLGWKNVKTGRPKGVVVDLLASVPAPAGSHDITVVTVRAEANKGNAPESRTFSFSTLDLERGPIHVPARHVYVTRADDARPFPGDLKRGKTIRNQIPDEPEQTLERAAREIPPLDPWKRQRGDKVYLPVAADASWQKFAIEYGGDIFINRRFTKAKGAEVKRLLWDGDAIRFKIGTGDPPSYREDHKVNVSFAEEWLPIVINRWENEGLQYEEEAFATLLEGPLDPNDPARSEQTPAVCMVRVHARNAGSSAARAHVTFSIEPGERLELKNGRVFATANQKGEAYAAPRLRAVMTAPRNGKLTLNASEQQTGSVRIEFDVPAGASESVVLRLPFVSDVTGGSIEKLGALGYERERDRVAGYWREMIEKTTRFSVPEPEFNQLARSVVPHIHISTTKDPKSGLYMVPAASYQYQVYANESCFQTMLLDVLGDTQRSRQYLRTLTELQGSRSFPGNYIKPHDGVFHGAKVDDDYDYTASDYGLDHGTVLWTLARHYLYTRDADWLRQTLPNMLKAIEWIERQRVETRKPDIRGERSLVHGLLPAGYLEDNSDWGYWYSVNSYCVVGMLETATVMREIGHPEAERIGKAAAEYHEDLRTSVMRCAELAPVTRMRDGTYSPYVPTKAYQRFRQFGPLRVQYYSRFNLPDVLPCYRLSATREVLYGPMILLNLHIFEPTEPIADWILDDWEDNLTLSSSGGFNVHGFTDDQFWFSQGGLVFQSNLQNPILVYLNRGEIPAALRGMYNALTSCLYPDINTLTEEYREWKHASGPFYKSPDEARFVNRLRDMLVLESGDELWLASGTPRRWLASREGIQVDSLNTLFGPVSYTLKAGAEPGTVVAKVTPPTRTKPRRVWLYLRLPDGKAPKSIRIGDADATFDAMRERILLPDTKGPIDVIVRY